MDGNRRPVVLDAPSNLGLRPPVPGCYKLAGALRDRGLVARIGAEDGGCLTPPRYDRSGWRPGDGVFHAAALASYARRLADRVRAVRERGGFLVVLGGDRGIPLGPALALRRAGRYGLAYLDGHSDFRHPGNSRDVGAAGGEALALVTGHGQPDLTALDGLGPYVRAGDAVLLGIRPDDEHADEVRAAGVAVWPATRIAADPAGASAGALARLERDGADGFWVHLDVDILDAAVLPAVDSPEPGGLDHAQLRALLRPVLASPACVGVDVCIFDPDLDPDGRLAAELADTLVTVLTTEDGR